MISRWFIGVNAKSKGFFKGFQYAYYYNNDVLPDPKPSFTKQSALAESFESKEDAEKRVAQYRSEAEERFKKASKKLDALLKTRPKWESLTDQERINFCHANEVQPTFQTTGYAGRGYVSHVRVSTYNGACKVADLKKEELRAIKKMNFDEFIKIVTTHKDHYQKQMDFTDEKLVIREQDIEIKFMDRERREIKWVHRDPTDTQGDYCNCCGGAIPDIPQLNIGRYYKERCVICAICMGKLADEAKIQAGKISDEVMEHYQTDRFIRSMD